MTERDQRWLSRVPCNLPARILSHEGWIPVGVRDLSRMGVRVAITPESAGLMASASLGSLTRRLAQLLPENPRIEIHHRMLGLLVGRSLRVVRVRSVPHPTPDVQLGCLFDEPLNDDEVAALGIALPRTGETVEEARRRYGAHPPRARSPALPPEAEDGDANEGLFGNLRGDDDPPPAA